MSDWQEERMTRVKMTIWKDHKMKGVLYNWADTQQQLLFIVFFSEQTVKQIEYKLNAKVQKRMKTYTITSEAKRSNHLEQASILIPSLKSLRHLCLGDLWYLELRASSSKPQPLQYGLLQLQHWTSTFPASVVSSEREKFLVLESL